MADLKKYWQDLRAIEETLPDFVWLTSLANRQWGHAGGSMVEVAAAVAAKLLHGKSHRSATEEEIAGHQSQREETQRQAFQQRLRDRGIAVVQIE